MKRVGLRAEIYSGSILLIFHLNKHQRL